MPADYKGMGHGHGKKPLPGFVWLLAGLAIGLFIALLVYLDKQPDVASNFGVAVQKELEKIKQNNSDASSKDSTASKKDSAKEEPKFNFYKILPELEVLIPDSETRPPASSQKDSLSAGKKYVLQAGSFKNKDDAEKLKANLTLLGFEPHIQNVTVNSTAWHRVRIGPYNQSSDLYDTIEQLQQHNISAVPMQLKSE